MEYEIGKQCFYQMLEKLFNSFYGKDYIKHNKIIFYEQDITIDGKKYNCQTEKNVLNDPKYNNILEDVQIISLEDSKKGTIKHYNNDFFHVTEETNEIEKLINEHEKDYPFLKFIPNLIDSIGTKSKNKKIIFSEKDIEKMIKTITYLKEEEEETPNFFSKFRRRKH